jgi:hypothetical protein
VWKTFTEINVLLSLREFILYLTFQYINFTVKITMHSMEISEFIFPKMFRGSKLQHISTFRESAGRRTDTGTNTPTQIRDLCYFSVNGYLIFTWLSSV